MDLSAGQAREAVEARYPGVSEAEAVAYARGFAAGLREAGVDPERARELIVAASATDALLAAGGAFVACALGEQLERGGAND